MFIVDLALQGFRDLKGSGQARFGVGLSVVHCAPIRPDTLESGIIELLFAEGYDPSAVRFAAAGAVTTKGVVTLQAHDKTTYRLVRDIVQGSCQLLQFDPQTKKFNEVASQAAEISQFLRGRIGVPGRSVFEKAFMLRAADFPSRSRGEQQSTPTMQVEQAAVPENEGAWLAEEERTSLRERLGQIEAALEAHAATEQLEYELDGKQQQLFELEAKIQEADFPEERLREVEAHAHAMSYLDVLPDDFLLKVEHYVDAKARRDRELQRWHKERQELERDHRTVEVEPILTDWKVLGGIVGGVAALAAGLTLEGAWALIAFADIPAFGLSASAIWQHLSARETRDLTARRLTLSEQRRESIEARDAEDIDRTETLLKHVNLDTVEQVENALAERAAARQALDDARRGYDNANVDPELARMRAAYQELRASTDELEHRLTSSSLGGDAITLKVEANQLRERLGLALDADEATALAPLATVETRALDEPEQHSATPPRSGFLAPLLEAASELLHCSSDEAARKIGERATPILVHLSGGRASGVVVEMDGTCVVAHGGEGGELEDVPAGIADMAYLSIRAALRLLLDGRSSAPMLVTDLETVFPGGEAFLLGYAGSLARTGQVIVIRGEPASVLPANATSVAFASR